MELQHWDKLMATTELKTIDGRDSREREHGFLMIELMISMVVLTVGLGGLLVLLITAMYNDKVSSRETTSTMVAEHILEQITAEGVNSNNPLTVTDCANNLLNIATARAPLGGGSGGANGGNGAALTADGKIDWLNQAFANVPAGYAIHYIACGNNGRQASYEIRWNVIQMSGNSRLTIIGAHPSGDAQLGGIKFVVPVNLRTID
jgi:type II secretory pathway pseudopilin PulG